jgi:hypothetical protein
MRLAIFLELMHTVSLTLHKIMNVTVYNQYLDIELASPVYFCNRGTYYECSVERTDVGTIMKISFRLDLDQDEPGGILMYAVQRKGNAGSDHQSSIDTVYAKVIEEASKMMRLLITWKIKHLEEPKVNVILVEYDNKFVLNEDKLARLYGKVDDIFSQCSNLSRRTWSMCDNTVLIPNVTMQKEGFESKMTISQGIRNTDTIRPMRIDPKRQVPSEVVIHYANLHH